MNRTHASALTAEVPLRRRPTASRSGWLYAAAGLLLNCVLAAVPCAVPLFWPALRPAAAEPLSERIANYEIHARLDEVEHTVTGRETLSWHNRGTQSARELCFHLYLNAFANNRSTLLRAAGEELRNWQRRKPNGWGQQEIQKLVVDGSNLTDAIEFVHPDDDNVDDRTVIRVPLARPVAAGDTARIEIEFVARLPKVFLRSGYAGPFHFVAQWFPKIGVYKNGEWNCHQYHLTTEFFADFGVYDVYLTVPSKTVVGATGVLQEERENDDGTKTAHYHAVDVHDFAWVADPRFLDIGGRFDDVALRLLLQPEHAGQAQRYLGAAKATLQRYRDWFGPYPYPQLTIVDPPAGALRTGGMEYPTLVTVGTLRWMPKGIRGPEQVTVHEIGHQYWYGMVANNEFEAAWLDEGINSYVERLVMDEAYGAPGSYLDLLGLRVDGLALQRFVYLLSPEQDPIARHAWQFRDPLSYHAISYSKTALVLIALERRFGRERVTRALRDYFEKWRFRHPTGQDFVSAMTASIGEDLGPYFDETLRETEVLDYAVTHVHTENLMDFAGYGAIPEGVAPETRGLRYRNEVIVERLGGWRWPVRLAVGFEDGTETVEVWDGQDRWHRLETAGPQRVEYAIVDPTGEQPLDVNRLNNSRMRSSGTRGVARLSGRWGFWLHNLLHFLAGL